MRVVVSGSSGLVGRALTCLLRSHGVECMRLVRAGNSHPEEIFWSIHERIIESEKLEGIDAVVHLAGESDEAVALLSIGGIAMDDVLEAVPVYVN